MPRDNVCQSAYLGVPDTSKDEGYMKRLLAVVTAILLLGGCASWFNTSKPDAQESPAQDAAKPASESEVYRKAYEAGVRDTLQEYKQRMRAREEYVFEPPVMQEVWVPARIVGGTFYPAHYEKVLVRPGRWVEENGVPAPETTNRGGGRQ